MLRPSYSELMETINTNELMSSKITSRYTIVLAAAKRARQIIDGANPLTYAPTDRAVSIAVKEMIEGKLHLSVQEDILDGTYEKMLKDQYKNRSLSGISKDDLREDLKDSYEAVKFELYEEEEEDFADNFADEASEADEFEIFDDAVSETLPTGVNVDDDENEDDLAE